MGKNLVSSKRCTHPLFPLRHKYYGCERPAIAMRIDTNAFYIEMYRKKQTLSLSVNGPLLKHAVLFLLVSAHFVAEHHDGDVDESGEAGGEVVEPDGREFYLGIFPAVQNDHQVPHVLRNLGRNHPGTRPEPTAHSPIHGCKIGTGPLNFITSCVLCTNEFT